MYRLKTHKTNQSLKIPSQFGVSFVSSSTSTSPSISSWFAFTVAFSSKLIPSEFIKVLVLLLSTVVVVTTVMIVVCTGMSNRDAPSLIVIRRLMVGIISNTGFTDIMLRVMPYIAALTVPADVNIQAATTRLLFQDG